MKFLSLSERSKSTRFAYIFMNVASEPFVALMTLLAFILRKDLHATTFQLSLFVTLKPVISFFSFYWSSSINRSREKILVNLSAAWLLGRIPFLLVPFFPNVWYLIFASASYQMFHRAGMPALMEILKVNMEKDHREKLFSFVFVLSFLESLFLGFFIGRLLDMNPIYWKYCFAVFALLSICSLYFQFKVTLPKPEKDLNLPNSTSKLLQPWKDCLYLMRSNREFFHFQIGFMIGGFGLMLIAPALVIFYAETIKLNHEALSIARYIWMGLGVVLTTGLWRQGLQIKNIRLLTALILLGFGLFPLTLLFALNSLIYLNVAFFIYGIAQAGSHLLWHLSGTLFATEQESSTKYTGVNIMLVGIRGLVAPILGGLLCSHVDSGIMLMIGSIICFGGSLYMILTKQAKSKRMAA